MKFEIKGHHRDGVWQELRIKEIDMDNDAHGMFAGPMTPAEANRWLGDGNPFSERFPTADLNEKQVKTLVGFSDIMVTGLGPSPAIRKLTDSGIVEVSVNWGKNPKDFGSGGKLWIAATGDYIAAAMWEGSHTSSIGPIRVYRWKPLEHGSIRRFGDKAEEVTYPQDSGHKGSTQATREFIREHWMDQAA